MVLEESGRSDWLAWPSAADVKTFEVQTAPAAAQEIESSIEMPGE